MLKKNKKTRINANKRKYYLCAPTAHGNIKPFFYLSSFALFAFSCSCPIPAIPEENS